MSSLNKDSKAPKAKALREDKATNKATREDKIISKVAKEDKAEGKVVTTKAAKMIIIKAIKQAHMDNLTKGMEAIKDKASMGITNLVVVEDTDLKDQISITTRLSKMPASMPEGRETLQCLVVRWAT